MFFIKEIRPKNCNLNEKVLTKAKFKPASFNHKPSALHTELLPDFGCRTTKLVSQKRRHLAVYCISFLWQMGTRPEKRRDYYLKNKPSSGILQQSNRNRLLWLCPNTCDFRVLIIQHSSGKYCSMTPLTTTDNHCAKAVDRAHLDLKMRYGLNFCTIYKGQSKCDTLSL